MDHESAVRQIQEDLPKFPEEVIRDWLGQCAPRLGWPPAIRPELHPIGPWAGVLLNRPLSFWKRVAWHREERPLRYDLLTPMSIRLVQALIDEYINASPNKYALPIADGRERFMAAAIYLLDHGVFPKAITVIEDDSLLTIADGYHRVAAFFAYMAMQKTPGIGDKFSTSAVALSTIQPMWIGQVGSHNS